jgi:hypothetical protein
MMKRSKVRACLAAVLIWQCAAAAYGQCRVVRSGVFRPQDQRKRVRLVARQGDNSGTHNVIFFRTSLRVNTDGAPNSYHPQDLTGSVRAINNICNGVGVKRNGVTLRCPQARQVFARFRDNNFTVPAGHTITWQNVIAATTTPQGRIVPCVFQSGEFAGFFGSLTSLKHGLGGAAAGECGHLNQLDQRHIRALVLPGGNNVVKSFGAHVGDLVFTFNPADNVASAAVVGDIGPPDNLGEGSVGLNMTLLGRTQQPTTYQEALRLDTGTRQMLVAILPGTGAFNLRRPFTNENVDGRVQEWLTQAGFASRDAFLAFMRDCNQ